MLCYLAWQITSGMHSVNAIFLLLDTLLNNMFSSVPDFVFLSLEHCLCLFHMDP
ncbi:hypothetical protein DsansV1_C06g0059351 [Dioscorea sansibarensis]